MAESHPTKRHLTPYDTAPLGPSEIRLLSVSLESPDLRLQTERQHIDSEAHFDAISYVWGSASASARVICNDAKLEVTPTALEMLKYLPFHRPHPSRLIWIDAICINQRDAQEKAEQIPLMSRIYSRAKSVVIWLPSWTPELKDFMDGFLGVFDSLRSAFEDKGSRVAWPSAEDPFWAGLVHLLSSEWFNRLWTFQEGILSKEAILLCRDTWIDLDKLLDFVCWASFYTEGIPYNGQVAFNLARQGCWTIRLYRYESKKGRKLKASEIPALLQKTRRRRAKEEVDRMWAISGLFSTELRDQLAHLVNYSNGARERWWLTFIASMKIVLDRSDELFLLDIPRSLPLQNTRFPSWCPDFQGRGAYKQVISASWHDRRRRVHLIMRTLLNDEIESEIIASKDAVRKHFRSHSVTDADDYLRTRGFQIDTVAEVVQNSTLLGAFDYVEGFGLVDKDSHDKQFAALEWISKSLDLARRVHPGSDSADRAAYIPPEFLMSFWTDHRINEHVETAYRDAMAGLKSNKNYLPGSVEPDRDVRAQFTCTRFWRLFGHVFISTESGRFGLATPGCKPGDRVCVFYGGESLYVVRPHANGIDAMSGVALTEFVGTAYIPHLMDQHRADWARIGPDETYVLA